MAEIKQNLVFLSKHLRNLSEILLHLVQHDILSDSESQEIENQITDFKGYTMLLSTIRKKDWETIKDLFLQILNETNNEICVNKIVGNSNGKAVAFVPPKILQSIWWPTKKDLIKSLYHRKVGGKLLVEDLDERICNAENRVVVITEAESDNLKLTGMGGIGKTLTANWYAHHYEAEYDHVIWIDCGDGSLLTCFKKLARDLEVKHFDRLYDLEDFATKSYEVLAKWKCLWIYDNAENYKGDNGIHKILPKSTQNFSCLITSRSVEWGRENGYGKINQFTLKVFEEMESIEFLKENLKIRYTEDNLKELCGLLGNLPLAMQLAIAGNRGTTL